MRLAIAIEHIPKLLPNNKVMVFYVAQGTTSYLDLASAIEEENTKFDLYAGLFFLVAGAIVFVVVKKVYNPKYNPDNPKIK
ncbi:hypothetical protein FACS189426_21960 [Bacteroidia bacterium]|nr:hypothetical protein FACS189426_21960 [Bacteroidia bacterium]